MTIDNTALSQLSENDIKALNDFSGYLEFMPTQVFSWLINSPCKITVLFTGNQFGKNECLSYQTLIDTPNGRISVGSLFDIGKPFEVYAWDGEKTVVAKATPPFKKKGLRKMYRITMSDGQWVEASAFHRILITSGDYISVDTLYDSFHGFPQQKVSEKCYNTVDGFSLLESNLDTSLSTHFEDVFYWIGKASNFQLSCLWDYRQYGELPHAEQDNDQVSVPSQDGVPPHDVDVLRVGVLAHKYTNIQKLIHDHLSTLYVYCRNAVQFFVSLGKVFYTTFRQLFREHQEIRMLSFEKLGQPQLTASTDWNTHLNGSLAYNTPLVFNGNHIISIEPIPCQEVYDFEVKEYHNYLAGGLIHHNTVIMDYFLRVWGKHPQKHKNILPDDKIRTIRFASENLPGESEGDEVKNTQYPVLKRRFNPSWVIKDITARKTVIQVQPQTMRILANGEKCMTKPVNFEFVSYGQSTQAQAGVQRKSVYIDESAPKDFFDEQIPRLLAADGDLILSYTPIPGNIGWEFDELYERARLIYRTKAVRDRIKERTGEDIPEIQETNSKDDIAVIMAATDDNPIYAKLAEEKSKRVGKVITVNDYITEMLGLISDEDVIDARRYGLFRQLSGKIFKAFSEKIHKISYDKYFPDGVPHEWRHFRGIDWHESTPWAIGWVAVSPNDEIFIYNEFNPSPEKMITLEIMRVVSNRSKDYKFDLSLIDPLAGKIQPNTGLSSLEDINRISSEFKRQGIGTGGWWQPWDTKSQKGRDEIRKRLQNATMCGVPFNNEIKKEGITKRLPTIWVCDTCPQTVLSLKNWRREEWGDRSALMSKDEKEKPQQRWSHFCTMLEGLMKRPEVFQARFHTHDTSRKPKEYFTNR
jgi:phage terminase large subunit-like protein